jgi:hypothetical protein
MAELPRKADAGGTCGLNRQEGRQDPPCCVHRRQTFDDVKGSTPRSGVDLLEMRRVDLSESGFGDEQQPPDHRRRVLRLLESLRVVRP